MSATATECAWGNFALHPVTLAATTSLDATRRTRHFADPRVEADFVRFRSAGRRPVIIATLFVVAAYYGAIALPARVVPLLVAAAAALVGAILEVVFMAACRTANSGAVAAAAAVVEHEARAALRMELISAVSVAVTFFVIAAAMTPITRARCGDIPTEDCVYSRGLTTGLGVWTVLIAPRAWLLLPVNTLTVLIYAVEISVNGLFASPLDTVVNVIVGVAYMIAFNVAAVVLEVRARRHFTDTALMLRADAATVRQGEATRALLASVLPAALLDTVGGDDAVVYRTDAATVCVVDIYDFAQWSTWHLEVDVVHILHLVTAAYDRVVAHTAGVERMMTYGDRYIACAGLLGACDGSPMRAMLECAHLLCRAGQATTNMLARASFAQRIALGGGALAGSVVGRVAMRFVVSGPALDDALEGLAACSPNGVIVMPSVRREVVAAAPDSTGAPNQTAAAPAPAVTRCVTEVSDSVVDPYEVAFPWMTFRDEAVQQRMNVAAGNGTVANTALPAIVAVGVLVVVVIEIAAENQRERHATQPAALALVAVSLVLSWLHVAIVASGTALPIALNATLGFAALASLGYGLLLLDCFAADPNIALVIVAGVRHFAGVPWLLQGLMIVAGVIVPLWMRRWDVTLEHQDTVGSFAQIGLIFIVVPVCVLLFKQQEAKAALASFAAAENVRACLATSTALAAAWDSLLGGVLPPHVVPLVSRGGGGGVVGGQQPRHLRPWSGLTVLQMAMCVPGDGTVGGKVAAMAVAWGAICGGVHGTGGVLEMLQATGDSFLVGGPFRTDAADEGIRVAAARIAVQLLGDLCALLRGTATFTAVVTAGGAYGALLGASLLTFRLFGAAVRESDAMLNAAPRVLGAPVNAAFASEAFRRQERNFAVRPADVAADAALSTARMPTASPDDSVSTAPEPASRGPGRAEFGEPQLWRVKGLGAALVSVINIPGEAEYSRVSLVELPRRAVAIRLRVIAEIRDRDLVELQRHGSNVESGDSATVA
jgi:hypothetical protein